MKKKSTKSILKSAIARTSKFWDAQSTKTDKSNYWLRGSLFDKKESMFKDKTEKESRFDHFALAQYQRAITNFVHIMTGNKDITVKYTTNGNSYTDGKTVTLSASIKEKDFDSNVGLALHEASHIIYTDFSLAKESIWELNSFLDNTDKLTSTEKINANASFGTRQNFKTIINIVEDLFIDAMSYAAAPGYRSYYQALYHKFFGDEKIIKGMRNKKYMEVNFENYIFHLCNVRNPERNLKALPGLEEIWNKLDLSNIRRLTTQQDRINLSTDILITILKNVLNSENQTNTNNTNQEQQSGSEGNESEGSEGNESEGSEGNESEGSELKISDSEGDNSEYTLTEKQINQLEKIFEKQQKFINGEAQKTKLTKDASLQVEALSSLDITEVMTAKHLNNESSTFKGVKTLVINNVTEKFMKSDIARGFGLAMHSWSARGESLDHAISLGKVLAKRLQVRNEERSLASKRLKSGKIDNRMLHEIGFDNYDIFKKVNVSQYKPSYIHISIDQSGSMSGARFEESVKFATMFAVASKSIKNLHVVVTARSTFHSGGNNKLKDTPYIVYLFDSKKHNINDIRRVFNYIRTSNLTPEGLTFEAIQNEVMKSSVNTDAYFINLCDGEPVAEYNNFRYKGDEAKAHSRKQVEKMKQRGVNVMNYFFGGQHEYRKFLKTYPKNSYMLNSAEEVNSIVKIMNRELLSGASKQND
jgi:hypothetical protein